MLLWLTDATDHWMRGWRTSCSYTQRSSSTDNLVGSATPGTGAVLPKNSLSTHTAAATTGPAIERSPAKATPATDAWPCARYLHSYAHPAVLWRKVGGVSASRGALRCALVVPAVVHKWRITSWPAQAGVAHGDRVQHDCAIRHDDIREATLHVLDERKRATLRSPRERKKAIATSTLSRKAQQRLLWP